MAIFSDQIQLVMHILATVPKHVVNADADTFPSIFLQCTVSAVSNYYTQHSYTLHLLYARWRQQILQQFCQILK